MVAANLAAALSPELKGGFRVKVVIVGYILDRDSGKENGNYYLGFRGLGIRGLGA